MIDIETDIINTMTTELAVSHPEVLVSSGYVQTFSEFPVVTVEEVENTTDSKVTNEGEVLSRVTFDINIYSNKNPGKRTEAREIAVAVDEIMIGAGFRCSWSQTVPNFYDTTIYRLTRRYVAKVDKDKTIYGG